MMLNGVRRSVHGYRSIQASGGGEKNMTLKDSMHLVADPENMHHSVREVFETMLGVQCRLEEGVKSIPGVKDAVSVTAVVGFGGILSGACVIRCDALAACTIAARMAGMEFETVDDIVKDAIGEICNMLAGTWKSKVPDLAANCGLSVPAVITGSDYNLHVQSPEFRICQSYAFDDTSFEMIIVCDALQ
ncbi:chemotaxis protein CheX [Telmatobacter sp. DSM 110680]|uniref:Chemotaxis protein CheX n=1 Tax=Telmatobacter sp. DSM 110680 TaxID=3036704 RepID=A0AAU7DFP3_9BACT